MQYCERARRARGAARAQLPGGKLATLSLGSYVCELPGDALGTAGIHMKDEDFAVIHASQYEAATGSGTYLMWGSTVEFTGGPRQGQRYRSVSTNQLRKLNPDGSDSSLRCTRAVLNNQQ